MLGSVRSDEDDEVSVLQAGGCGFETL
jgi:hypothetical protein